MEFQLGCFTTSLTCSRSHVIVCLCFYMVKPGPFVRFPRIADISVAPFSLSFDFFSFCQLIHFMLAVSCAYDLMQALHLHPGTNSPGHNYLLLNIVDIWTCHFRFWSRTIYVRRSLILFISWYCMLLLFFLEFIYLAIVCCLLIYFIKRLFDSAHFNFNNTVIPSSFYVVINGKYDE